VIERDESSIAAHDLTGRIPIDDLLVACRRSKGLLITQILASINLEQWLVGDPKGGGSSLRLYIYQLSNNITFK